MTRAAALFVLGVAALLVGAACAFVAHHNLQLGSELSQQVHANQDVRATIAERAARVLERRAQLRAEFDREWHTPTDAASQEESVAQ